MIKEGKIVSGFEGKKILLADDRELLRVVIPEYLNLRVTKLEVEPHPWRINDLVQRMESGRIDGAVIHVSEEFLAEEIITAHRQGKKVVALIRDIPLTDRDEQVQRELIKSSVPCVDKIGQHFYLEALGLLGSLFELDKN